MVSPSDELELGHVNERNPFLPEFLLAMVLECELGWCSKINKADNSSFLPFDIQSNLENDHWIRNDPETLVTLIQGSMGA